MSKKIQNLKIEKALKKIKYEAMKSVVYHRGNLYNYSHTSFLPIFTKNKYYPQIY